MANPNSERPTHTPDGFEFPYSHFGDPEQRTKLLRDIGSIIGIRPQTVLNMGCGYDITPSDVFPNARVIHVDLEESIVSFLNKHGFESYEPSGIPENFRADLAISILGPRVEDHLIASSGVLLTTATSCIPDGMDIRGLVYFDGEEPRIMGDLKGTSALWGSNREIHLAAYVKL